MRDKNVGKIIYTLRTCNHISQEKLARGLCSVPALSRIESSERIPDKLLLDALLQRLGKSSNKLESIISVNDYELYLYRERIQRYIIGKKYEKAKELLAKYEQRKEAEEKVHKQYILKVKAALYELADNDFEMSRHCVEEAIKITMPDGGMAALENSLLSTCEIQLLLMEVNHYESDKEKNIWEFLDKLNQYVREHYTDEEELVNVYAKVARAEARILMEHERYEKAVEICESALDLLGKNGILTNFRVMLSMLIESLRHLDETEKLEKMLKWEEILNQLYKEYDIYYADGASFLILENSQCEILLVNELIQRGRKVKGMTQEKLSENICTPENLSAIESGKRAPSIRNYDKFMEKLGMDKDFYNSFLSAEQFEIYELRRECNRLVQYRKFAEAEEVLDRIEEIINVDIPVNKQYICFNRILFLHEQGKISVEEALTKEIEALEMTFDYNDGNFRTDIILSQEEAKIINYIGSLYKRMNQTEKAIAIYSKAIESYQSSKVSMKNHYAGANLILANLCIALEETNQLEKSMEMTKIGIAQVLDCGRGGLLASFLANEACCYEKLKNKKACQKYLEQAFYISDIMKNDALKNAISCYYKNIFKTTI